MAEEQKEQAEDSKQSVIDEGESDQSVMSSLYKDATNMQLFFGKTDEINHLTMIVNAIYHLNGSEDDYDSFYNRYINDYDLELVEQKQLKFEINDKNWQSYANNKQNYSIFSAYFDSKWELMGRKNILKIYLPILARNPSCGFFHPLIRMGHTTYLEDTKEISNTLSVWACCYFKMPDYLTVIHFNKGDDGYTLETIFDRLRESKELQSMEFITGTHEQRINKVLESKEFYHLCSGYLKNDDTIKTLSIQVCNFYQVRPCFATQHLVEACEGLRQVLQMILKEEDKDHTIFQFFLGVCATFVSIGCPKVGKVLPPSNIAPWSSIYNKALINHDEHTLLFVYACSKLFYAFKGFKNYEMFRWVAACEVNLIKQ